jgi:hypothetical protein
MTNDLPPLILVPLLLRVCDVSWHAQRAGSGLRDFMAQLITMLYVLARALV